MLLYEGLKSDAAKATNDLSYCSYVLGIVYMKSKVRDYCSIFIIRTRADAEGIRGPLGLVGSFPLID